MDEQHMQMLEQLLLKKLEGTLSAEEQQLLDAWTAEKPANRQLLDQLADQDWLAAQMAEFEAIRLPRPAGRPAHRVHFIRRWGWVAAALLVLIGAAYYIAQPTRQPAPLVQKPAKPDVMPGREGAVLTLADGSQVVLDSAENRELASQGGSRVLLTKGQLAYDPSDAAPGTAQYNTISIPRGRQFRLLLPDGTKVWLNSASTIRFPVAFTGADRTVAITGEAYFEVTKNERQPFIVTAGPAASLKVLGTSFNVKAYTDERVVTTTLVEGKLAVESRGGQPVILAPGQQASITGSELAVTSNAGIDAVVAWKNGLFNFNDKKLEEVMRELARWYDLEIVYEKGVPDIVFGGEMSRNEPLSNVILGLQDANVKFRIEANRRLVVLP